MVFDANNAIHLLLVLFKRQSCCRIFYAACNFFSSIVSFFAIPVAVELFCNGGINQFFFRHHTNPVGTEWKWQMNEPSLIVDGAMKNHFNMIKQFKGTLHLIMVFQC